MPEMHPDLPSSHLVNVTGRSAAHLASEAVALKDLGAKLLRNARSKCDALPLRRWLRKHVLTGLKIDGVIVE